ncbi:hypothetical protein D3C86_1346230 [compost metagenome]
MSIVPFTYRLICDSPRLLVMVYDVTLVATWLNELLFTVPSDVSVPASPTLPPLIGLHGPQVPPPTPESKKRQNGVIGSAALSFCGQYT